MCHTSALLQKGKIELADIFDRFAWQYCQQHRLPLQQHKVISAICQCRTKTLGGHMQECDHCGANVPHYNSCRNRHCPKCQLIAKAKWLTARQQELLPVEYFHVVFTLPHELNELAQFNQALIYKLLFQSAWHAVSILGQDPKRLNGETGMLAILHTWGQNLNQHIHIHCVIPGGAWQKNTKTWKSSKHGFLFPVKALSRVFRGKYVSLLREAYENVSLKFNSTSNSLSNPTRVSSLLNNLMKKDWVVYTKKPFGGPRAVLNYIGRYTHRVAISNDRILDCNNENVKFKWRDYAHGNQVKTMELKADEFIRRFLLHTLPHRFTRIRCFGFLANACKNKKIQLIRENLDNSTTEPATSPVLNGETSSIQIIKILTGIDVSRCPICKQGSLRTLGIINAKCRAPPRSN